MAQKKFRLLAQVSSDNPSAIKPCLERIIGNKGTIRETGQGFKVEALTGSSTMFRRELATHKENETIGNQTQNSFGNS
jgi:hypothetical protein